MCTTNQFPKGAESSSRPPGTTWSKAFVFLGSWLHKTTGQSQLSYESTGHTNLAPISTMFSPLAINNGLWGRTSTSSQDRGTRTRLTLLGETTKEWTKYSKHWVSNNEYGITKANNPWEGTKKMSPTVAPAYCCGRVHSEWEQGRVWRAPNQGDKDKSLERSGESKVAREIQDS